MKRIHPIPLAEAIDAALADEPLRKPVEEYSAIRAFYSITENIRKGEPVGDNDRLKDGTIYVKINSFPLRSEIMMRRSQIIAEINRILGQNIVNNIRFT